MKKKIVFLSALGVAGGLLYALESQRQRKKSGNEKNASSVSGNGQPAVNGGHSRNSQANSIAQMGNTEGSQNQAGHAIDDQGTDQAAASQILKHIRDHAFEASDEKLALALGRPTQEIEEWTRGTGLIDGDVILKARTLAIQRGFEV